MIKLFTECNKIKARRRTKFPFFSEMPLKYTVFIALRKAKKIMQYVKYRKKLNLRSDRGNILHILMLYIIVHSGAFIVLIWFIVV